MFWKARLVIFKFVKQVRMSNFCNSFHAIATNLLPLPLSLWTPLLPPRSTNAKHIYQFDNCRSSVEIIVFIVSSNVSWSIIVLEIWPTDCGNRCGYILFKLINFALFFLSLCKINFEDALEDFVLSHGYSGNFIAKGCSSPSASTNDMIFAIQLQPPLLVSVEMVRMLNDISGKQFFIY